MFAILHIYKIFSKFGQICPNSQKPYSNADEMLSQILDKLVQLLPKNCPRSSPANKFAISENSSDLKNKKRVFAKIKPTFFRKHERSLEKAKRLGSNFSPNFPAIKSTLRSAAATQFRSQFAQTLKYYQNSSEKSDCEFTLMNFANFAP